MNICSIPYSSNIGGSCILGGTYTTIVTGGYSIFNGSCSTYSSTRMCSTNKDYLVQITMDKFGLTEEDIHKDLSWIKSKIRDYNITSIIG